MTSTSPRPLSLSLVLSFAAPAKYERVTGASVTGNNDTRHVLALGAGGDACAGAGASASAGGEAVGYIVGYVDGLCDHLDTSDDDDWKTVPSVVEIKNRVGLRAGDRPPPFYDQIQCVCYMMMTQRTRCDLVEVFRDAAAKSAKSAKRPRGADPRPAQGTGAPTAGAGAGTDGTGGGGDGITIRVTAVNLEGPPFHGDNWRQRIVPRCIEVCKTLQAVRADDGKR